MKLTDRFWSKTEADVLRIRAMSAEGWTNSALGKVFGVQESNISLIKNRVTWKHI